RLTLHLAATLHFDRAARFGLHVDVTARFYASECSTRKSESTRHGESKDQVPQVLHVSSNRANQPYAAMRWVLPPTPDSEYTPTTAGHTLRSKTHIPSVRCRCGFESMARAGI